METKQRLQQETASWLSLLYQSRKEAKTVRNRYELGMVLLTLIPAFGRLKQRDFRFKVGRHGGGDINTTF